jgi:hypothetical protein
LVQFTAHEAEAERLRENQRIDLGLELLRFHHNNKYR